MSVSARYRVSVTFDGAEIEARAVTLGSRSPTTASPTTERLKLIEPDWDDLDMFLTFAPVHVLVYALNEDTEEERILADFWGVIEPTMGDAVIHEVKVA